MTHDSLNPPTGPDDAGDPGDEPLDEPLLDELVAGARWPSPSPESEARLRDAWRAMSEQPLRPASTLRRFRVAGGAVAAAVILALSLLAHHRPEQSAIRPNNSPGPIHVANPSTEPDSREPASEEPTKFALWRPATAWEVALVNRRSGAAGPSAATSTRPTRPARPGSLNARVDRAVEEIASGSAPDVAQVAAALLGDFSADRIEQRLAPVVVHGSDGRRDAAVRLLAEVATPRSAPLLASLATDPSVRGDAVAGLVRIGDVPTLAALVASARDDGERRRLIAALLRRDAGRSVPVYLALVAEPRTSDAALAALADMRNPPVDALFDRLDDPRRANRIAAARALGRIDGPSITARLAEMVRLNVNRHEALTALASSTGADARAFFDRALSSKQLGAAARTARADLGQF